MIKVKGYGITTSTEYATEAITKEIGNAVSHGLGIVDDKEEIIKFFEKAKKETEEESGKELDGIFVVEVEIEFVPKIVVKKVEYAKDTSNDN